MYFNPKSPISSRHGFSLRFEEDFHFTESKQFLMKHQHAQHISSRALATAMANGGNDAT